MGDIIRPGSVPMRLAAEVIGTAPIERLDVLHGVNVVQTARPFTAADLGRRVRVTWQGAEYRGRETVWQGKLTLAGNRFARGLGRRISVYRLPEREWSRHLAVDHVVTFPGGADLPVYVRVTQSDGHQAWSSPIYLIA